MTQNNKWYQQMWLPFAAITYVVICIFDFMIMPIYVTAHNSRIENIVVKQLQGKDAVTFADMIIKSNQAQRQWNPLTLLGAGMFHLSFGALLTGGAVTRGFAKKTEIEAYYRYGVGKESEMNFDNNHQYNNYQPYKKQQQYRQYEDYNNYGPMPKTPE